MQSINQHLLESITTSQKNSVFHKGFGSISGFLSASKSYDLLIPCTNFCVSLCICSQLDLVGATVNCSLSGRREI